MIAVTGATGHLGRLIVEALLERGVPAGEIVAAARNPAKAEELARRGVQVRQADYDRPETLASAFEGVDRLVFVSGSEVGRRVAQHGNVVEAAKGAGVRLIAYTSILNVDTTQILLAEEHKATERLIRESGIPFVFLRNGWYLENYTPLIPQALERGELVGSAGEGRVSAAARADYAAAAAVVVTSEGHENRAYELGGDEAFTMAEFAEEISRQSGRRVVYRNLPAEEYVQVLVGAGVPEPYARALADSDLGIERGELYTDSRDLSRLIGRPTTSLREAVAAALGR